MATYKLVNADQLDSDLTAVGNAIRSKGGTSAGLSFPAGMVSAIGAISTGVELNFDVVPGLTQPGTAAENTIWVKTEKIGAWHFSATQPDGMQEWDVWFPTGTSSAVEFDALKKNGIQVYPISAKQYVSGVRVPVAAKIYQNGEWEQFSSNWNGELYEIGNQCTDKTGGWSGSGWTDYAGSYTEQSATIDGTGIVMKTSGSGNRACVCGTENKVSFNGYTKIAVTVASFSNSFFVGISPGKQFWDDEGETPMLALKRITAKGTANLSIPTGVSSAYVVVYCFSESGAKTFGTVSKIQMLK